MENIGTFLTSNLNDICFIGGLIGGLAVFLYDLIQEKIDDHVDARARAAKEKKENKNVDYLR